MTVRAEEDVVVQVLGRETLSKIIGQDFREVMFKNYVKSIVQKNRMLFNLLKRDEETFFDGMRVQYKKTNEVVFKKGTTVQKLLVLMEGKLKKFRSPSYLAEAGQTWGESFLYDNVNVRLEDDIIVETESVIIELNFISIRQIHVAQPFVSEKMVKVEHAELNPEDLKFLYYLDKGLESTMLLARYLDKTLIGKLYRKTDIEKSNLGVIVKQEMEVSEMLRHPFIPKFHQRIETKRHILKLSDFVPGESMYESIR